MFKFLKVGCSKVTWTQNCLVIDVFGNKLKGVLLKFFSYIIVVSWKLISTIDLYILQTLKGNNLGYTDYAHMVKRCQLEEELEHTLLKYIKFL